MTDRVNALEELKEFCVERRVSWHHVTDIRIFWHRVTAVGSGQIRRIEDIHLLDFEYDSGYGTQHLYGTVWLSDGTWFERREYDGSERWMHVKPPNPKDVQDYHEHLRKLWS